MFAIFFFFFNDTATTEIYTLSLHDALPIFAAPVAARPPSNRWLVGGDAGDGVRGVSLRVTGERRGGVRWRTERSEEHTSELQSRQYLVCRLLLEKKKNNNLYLHTLIEYSSR